MTESLFLGMDIGTQGTELVVVNGAGKVVAAAHQSYTFESPSPGWAEQDPNLWWNAVVEGMKDLQSNDAFQLSEIQAVGVAGQMHSSVLLDSNGNLLGNAILWNDVRTKQECDEIESVIGKDTIYSLTSNAILPGFTLPKLQWIKNHEPERFKQIAHVLMPKDYIVYKLTGELSADVTDASGTGVFQVKRRKWSKEIIDALHLSEDWFPDVHESQAVVGRTTRSGAQSTGLQTGVPVIAGAGDNAAGAVGNHVWKSGSAQVSVGTSGTVFVPLDGIPDQLPKNDRARTVHLFCHSLPGKWHAMGVTLSAGLSLRWLKDMLGADSYEALTENAANMKPGADGLIFLPYLNGDRTPINDAFARGLFFGLGLEHTQGDIARAVLEGVSYSLRDCLTLIKEMNPSLTIDQTLLTGGAVKSPVWSQIIADVLHVDVEGFEEKEGPAYGAALLAGLGTGCWKDAGDLPKDTEISKTYYQNKRNQKLYDEAYQLYKQLYPALGDLYAKRQNLLNN